MVSWDSMSPADLNFLREKHRDASCSLHFVCSLTSTFFLHSATQSTAASLAKQSVCSGLSCLWLL